MKNFDMLKEKIIVHIKDNPYPEVLKYNNQGEVINDKFRRKVFIDREYYHQILRELASLPLNMDKCNKIYGYKLVVCHDLKCDGKKINILIK